MANGRSPGDDGFHEIQLSGKQIVFLFMAATVVAVGIFLLGVLVGRGVQAGRAAEAAAEAAVATPPPEAPAGSQPAGEPERLTYGERLAGDAPAAEQVARPAAPPVTPAEPVSGGGTSSPAADPWVVQVAALRDRAAALAIVTRLTGKGYTAFVLDPAAGSAAPVYRVRVGPFPQRADAEAMARRLEREEQFKPLITR